MSLWPSDVEVNQANGTKLTNTIFVRNLSFEVSNEILATHFEDIGPVKIAFVARDKGTQESRGFGFVEFAVPSDAESAIQLHGQEWFGRKLKIELALRKDLSETDKQEEYKKFEKKKVVKSEDGDNKRDRNEKFDKREQGDKREDRREKFDKREKFDREEKSLADRKKKTKKEEKEVKRSDLSDELLSTIENTTVLFTGFNSTVAGDRISASMKRLAPIKKTVYPSPESKGDVLCARVTFETADAAKKAVKRYHNKVLRDCTVTAVLMEGAVAVKAARLIVRNLSFHVRSPEIQELFEKYGKVLSVNLPTSDAGLVRGFGFVQMQDVGDAQSAIDALNGHKIQGRPIAVDFSVSKDDYDRRIASKPVEAIAAPEPVKRNSDDMKDGDDESDDESDDEELGANITEGGDDTDLEISDDEEEEEKNISHDPNRIEKSRDVHHGCSIFIRNLAYDTTEQGLVEKFSPYGRIKFAKIVKDKILNRSMGTAFVQFYDKKDTDALLAAHDAYAASSNHKDKYKKGKSANIKDGAIRLDGRDLSLARSVDREQSKTLQETNKTTNKDKRNIYLAREGVILADSPAAADLTKADLAKRIAGWKDKKNKLKDTNFSVSRVRLSVRNIPDSLSEKELKKLFLETVQNDFQKAGRPIGGIHIRQTKICRDSEKINPDGSTASRGFGFIEFSEHDHALHSLRALNNNPDVWSASRRPIVEFALENAKKLLVRKKFMDKGSEKTKRVDEIKKQAEAAALAALPNAQDLMNFIHSENKKSKRPSRTQMSGTAKKRRTEE